MFRPEVRDWMRAEQDYERVYQFRNWNLQRFRDTGRWDIAYTYYRDHPVEAIEDFLCTYDPRKAAKGLEAYLPFVLFPRQREFITFLDECYVAGEDGLADKSREVGMTWLACAWAWHKWTFGKGIKIGFGSRKEDLVDQIGNPDSILEKMRLIMRRLPLELKPKGWDEKSCAPRFKIINPQNGNTIIGEGGRNIGRGGRSSAYFVDEAAFLDHPEDAERALSANTNTIYWISTPPLAAGNPFVKKRFGGEIKIFSLHWTQDPRKDEGWYQKQKRRFAHDPRLLASEVDLDYDAALGDDVAIPPVWVHSSRALRDYLEPRGELDRFLSQPGVGGQDVGGGSDKSVFVARYGPVIMPSIEWSDADTINVAARARQEAQKARCPLLHFDSIGIGKGVAASLKRMEGIRANGVNSGESPTRDRWPDGRRAKDKFANLRAEMWWKMREGLRVAHVHWMWIQGKGGEDVTEQKLEDMILLPKDSKMTSELSMPQRMFNERGKLLIESKKHMIEQRGLHSPDHADAAVLTLAPVRKYTGSSRTSSRS